MKTGKFLFFLLALIIFSFSIASADDAAVINPNIPGVPSGGNPAQVVANLYTFALLVSGLLAFAVIVYGAVERIFAAGNPSKISDADDRIKDAFLGLLLLAGAYILLNTINPNLTKLQLPELAAIPPTTAPAAPAPSGPAFDTCPLKLAPLTGDALAIEQSANSDRVLLSSGDSNINNNLQKLAGEIGKLRAALRTKKGVSITVNSAYRPLAYQNHLYELSTLWNDKGLKNGTAGPTCADLATTVKAELIKHGLLRQDGSASPVSFPDPCRAPHVLGRGVDITLGDNDYLTINFFIQQNVIDLSWQGVPNDQYHFNLVNPPYTGCASVN